jgi:hypothetical protein
MLERRKPLLKEDLLLILSIILLLCKTLNRNRRVPEPTISTGSELFLFISWFISTVSIVLLKKDSLRLGIQTALVSKTWIENTTDKTRKLEECSDL